MTPDYAARNALDTAIWDSTLAADERLALHAFRYWVNRPHGLDAVWVPRKILKGGTGLPSRRAQRAMDGLVAKGWLEVITPGAGTRATVYRIVLGGSCDPALGTQACDPTVGSQTGPSDPTWAASDPRSTAGDPTVGRKLRNSQNSFRTYGAAPAGPVRRDDDAARLDAIETAIGGWEGHEETTAEAMLDRLPDSAIVNVIRVGRRKSMWD
ncbi:hypothetical protein G5V59_25650 [Nocardioides sp. W3-2-3]|uniref:hypothetical protein n=1 Tax=Nocardioides convexus TaxID=2712224 RepID=UPI00241884C0|nr:hypothetical protein [Nocardioides convexus]NHA01886.1 hypothetical protein [Nocardioides convexus]